MMIMCLIRVILLVKNKSNNDGIFAIYEFGKIFCIS